ncbi:hypothetical protein HK103_004454 [Boothiomyces macroporosus]|uniref:Uncharacterized protein n=1 Tax=Boothiomyces macroporosus TaxID=261099 RepID=A0AAD5UH50_9FUNG|nr:hypothetical protein HK103_004454 [Boothiomyces macroporosus]
MEGTHQAVTTLSAQVSKFKYYENYFPQMVQFISREDYQLIIEHLNVAARKAPIPGTRFLYFLCIILFFGIHLFLGLSPIGYSANFALFAIPFAFICISTFSIALYRYLALKAVDDALRTTVGKLNTTLTSKKLWLEYKKVLVSGGLSKTYRYDVNIYHLPDTHQHVVDMDGALGLQPFKMAT